jgi:DNA-binding NtrC family response regulator
VLQEQEFERVGGSHAIKVDVRIIATTNRDLAEYSSQGMFRQDLYFRLSVIPISIPPLRDRPDDIPLLASRFALRTSEETGKPFHGFAPETVAMLQEYAWPGNVRELQHSVERAVILSPDSVLVPHSFDGQRFGLTQRWSGPTPTRSMPSIAMVTASNDDPEFQRVPMSAVVLTSLDVNEAESKLIVRALDVSGGNRTRAAEMLGISVRTLRNKLNTPAAS